MTIWRFSASFLLAAFACLAYVVAAQAGSMTLLGTGNGSAPGQGWLSEASCSGNFSVENFATYSNTFTSWTSTSGGGPTAPTVTSGATDPLSGSTAYQVVFHPTSGTNAYGVIDLPTSIFGPYANIFRVWAKVVSNTGAGTIWATMSAGTNFARTALNADGAYHLIIVTVPVTQFGVGTGEAPQIGVNLNDPSQSATTGTITVDLWNAGIFTTPVGSYITDTMITGSLATTGSAVVATVSIPCPAHMAFRDFSVLTPSSSNPIISENTGNAWESGGVSNPYVSPASTWFSGGNYYGFTNATSSNCHGDWMSFSLYKSANLIAWTEDTTNAPYLQAFGSGFTGSCTQGTGIASFWELHPAPLPFGCTVSAVTHNFCVLYGAESTTATLNTFMAWSDTIDGNYTPAGCTGPGECLAPTPVIPSSPTGVPTGGQAPTNQNVPAVFNVGGSGGTNYIVTGNAAAGNSFLHEWSTPAIPTVTQPQWLEIALATPLAADWDTGSSYIDPAVLPNDCHFYEMFYTAFKASGLQGSGKEQAIGYAVSPDGQMWFKWNTGPIIPYTSSMYFSTLFLGDSSPAILGGQFIWLGNYDNGTTQSRAVAATMPQGTCPA